MLSNRGICWHSLEYKVIRVDDGTALNTKLFGYMSEQLEMLIYRGICWNSLKYKFIRVYVGKAWNVKLSGYMLE